MNMHEIIQSYVDDVARCLPRRIRNDVGFELKSLLMEQVNERAVETGAKPDADELLQLLESFGRPEDVAERYLPAGFIIVEPSAAPRFVKIAAIGVLLQWIASGFLYYQAAASGQSPGALQLLAQWWLSSGLGALWWPGFLVFCYGIDAWLKRRRPAAGEWRPQLRELDRQRVNAVGMTVLILANLIGAAYLLVGPALLAERLLPSGFNTSWAVYAEGFRSLWLPLFVGLFAADIFLCAIVLLKGRWTIVTRRIELGFSIAWIGALVACGLGGKMFAVPASDEVARFALLLIAFFVAVDVLIKLRREYARVRMPAFG